MIISWLVSSDTCDSPFASAIDREGLKSYHTHMNGIRFILAAAFCLGMLHPACCCSVSGSGLASSSPQPNECCGHPANPDSIISQSEVPCSCGHITYSRDSIQFFPVPASNTCVEGSAVLAGDWINPAFPGNVRSIYPREAEPSPLRRHLIYQIFRC